MDRFEHLRAAGHCCPAALQVTSIFRWNNPAQNWDFWYRGFPDGFHAIQNLIHGESCYLFYANGVAWVAEW